MALEDITRVYDLPDLSREISYTEPITIFSERVEEPRTILEPLCDTRVRITKEILGKIRGVLGDIKVPGIGSNELENNLSEETPKLCITRGNGKTVGTLDFMTKKVYVKGYTNGMDYGSKSYVWSHWKDTPSITLTIFGQSISPEQYNKLQIVL